MSTATNWYIGNDTVVTYSGMQNGITDAYINGATVTASVKDLAGNVVSGGGPHTLSYVAASDGVYRGTIDKAISLSAGVTYYLEITATSAGIDDFRRIRIVAAYRETT